MNETKRNPYSFHALPKKVEKENRTFSLICQLEKELQEICDGSESFILSVAAARKSLKILKKFF